jgi:cytochrome c551/c552
MKLRPSFRHAILLIAFGVILSSCGGESSSAVEQELPSTPSATKVSANDLMGAEIKELLTKNTCLGCHRVDKKLVGPSYLDIAAKGYSIEEMVSLMTEPKPENWPGFAPMASMAWVPADQLTAIATWISELPQTAE